MYLWLNQRHQHLCQCLNHSNNKLAWKNKLDNLINDLPQKDISVNIDSIRQFIGLAEGGEVPTTEKEFARLGIYKRPEDYDTKEYECWW